MMLRHFATYLLARGFPGLLNFLAIFVYSRLISPGEYGKYATAIALIGLINALFLSWLRLGVLRYLPGYVQEERNSFLSTVMVAFIAYTFISGGLIVLCVLTGLLDESFSDIWILGMCLLWVSGFFEINLEIFRSSLSPNIYGWLYLCKAGLGLGLSTGLILLFSFGTHALIIGSLAAMLLPSLFVLKSIWSGVSFRLFDLKKLKILLVYGLPLTMTLTMGFIIDSSDRLFLGWYSDSKATGLYSVTYDFGQQTIILLMSIVNLATYPIIIHVMEKGNIREIQIKLEQSFLSLLLISLPAVTGLIILSPNIASLFFGEAYREAAAVVIPWIALISLIQGLKVFYLDLSFQLKKQTKQQIYPVLIGAVINIVLNIMLIPTWQIKGALYSTIIAYLMASIISWRMGLRCFPLPFPKVETFKIVLVTMIMMAVLYPFQHFHGFGALFVQLGIGMLTYGAGLWLFNIRGIRSTVQQVISKRNVSIKVKG